jgi:hypothetical protein
MSDTATGTGAAADVVEGSISRLESLVTALPSDERRAKALYHLERLRLAFRSSHQEAVRFAAFTVNKTVHDAADWSAEVTSAMNALRESLRHAGHEF